MLTVPEILEELDRLPEQFRRHYEAGEYGYAAQDFSHAVRVSRFIGIGDEWCMQRFSWEEVRDAFGKSRRNTGGKKGAGKQNV